MKNLLFIFICFYSSILFSQTNTEIFLFDIEIKASKIELKNGKNISQNEGYDNQPSFLDERYIVFSSTREGQTDIAKYDTRYNGKIWVNFTEGGEYTPLKIPNTDAVSAVRLDKDGKQRLYSYNLSNTQSSELVEGLVVAYYTWFNEKIIVSAVIEEENLNLYVINIEDGTRVKYATKVGRSFHTIPNSNLVSFISKEAENQWQIKSLNPLTGEIKLIANTMQSVEDICWLNNKTILSGKGNSLYKLTLNKDDDWKKLANLSPNGITNITRLSVNDTASKLIIAGDISMSTVDANNENVEDTNDNTNQTNSKIIEEKAAAIVQRHIEPFNTRNLDDFANAFDVEVKVNRFPNIKMYAGRSTLKENYRQFYKNNEKSNVKVLNRMTLKNIVIDEELATLNNTTSRQITIYETDDEDINSMTFLSNSATNSNPEIIVNKQLVAYNKKDIEAFISTYSSDIKLYKFPDTETTNGLTALKKRYASLFERVPDLNAEIMNRMVLGNKIIDKEKVTFNSKTFYAIAVYEVNNGLISKVTFIQ